MQRPIWVTRQPNVKSYYSSHGGHEARGIQWHLSRHMLVVMLLENWVHLLLGVRPKVTKPEVQRQKNLSLAANKENTRDFSQSSVSPISKNGEILS